MANEQKNAAFQDILAIASPKLRPVCEALRQLVISEDAAFYEIAWPKLKIASFGVGPKKMTQHYTYIAIQASHINFGFYHGASLRDPTGLLEGTGKELRHIKVHDVAHVKNPDIRTLLRQAIEERKSYA